MYNRLTMAMYTHVNNVLQQNIIAGLSPDYEVRPKVQRGGLQSRAEQREVWTEWLAIYKIQIRKLKMLNMQIKIRLEDATHITNKRERER